MDLDELQSVRDRERQTDKLQQLRTSFYADAGEFIQELRDQRARAADRADDPFDAPEVNRLSDEIDTAEQTVEAIYEKRVGKIVKAASFAAADLPAEVDGMTAEEEELFDSLVTDIKDNRGHVLDVLAGDADADPAGGNDGESGPEKSPVPEPSPTDPPSDPTPDSSEPTRTPPDSEPDRTPPEPPENRSGDTEVSAADLMGDGPGSSHGGGPREGPPGGGDEIGEESSGAEQTEPSSGTSERDATGSGSRGSAQEGGAVEETPPVRNDGGTAAESVDRTTVRITADVGSILGVDQREYDLSTDDVVTLPAQNADPLVDRDAAQRLD